MLKEIYSNSEKFSSDEFKNECFSLGLVLLELGIGHSI